MKYNPDNNTYTATSHFDFIGWDVLSISLITPSTARVIIRRRERLVYSHIPGRPRPVTWFTDAKAKTRVVISRIRFVPIQIYNFRLIPGIRRYQ